MMDMLLIAIALLVGVFLLSQAFTRRLASAEADFSILDKPNERSLHVRPTPRTGGLAILLSFICGVAVIAFEAARRGGWPTMDRASFLWILAMLLLIAFVAICDDRWGVAPWLRLMFHVAGGSGVVYGAKLAVRQIEIPLLVDIDLGAFAGPFSLLLIVWLTNLYNFMDGMDGLASAMSIFGFGLIAALAAYAGVDWIVALAGLVVAAVAGFLVHNRPPASIFMGDSGSTSLGFLAGALTVAAVDRGVLEIAAAFLAFSPFLVDATITLLRRLSQRKRVWQAHREHYYQRLVLAGWSHGRTLAWESGLMLLSIGAAMGYQFGSSRRRFVILCSAVAGYFLLAYAVRRVESPTARHNLHVA